MKIYFLKNRKKDKIVKNNADFIENFRDYDVWKEADN